MLHSIKWTGWYCLSYPMVWLIVSVLYKKVVRSQNASFSTELQYYHILVVVLLVHLDWSGNQDQCVFIEQQRPKNRVSNKLYGNNNFNINILHFENTEDLIFLCIYMIKFVDFTNHEHWTWLLIINTYPCSMSNNNP